MSLEIGLLRVPFGWPELLVACAERGGMRSPGFDGAGEGSLQWQNSTRFLPFRLARYSASSAAAMTLVPRWVGGGMVVETPQLTVMGGRVICKPSDAA